MPIAVLVLALVAYGYVMLAYPEYRTIGLAVGGAAAAGLGLYLWLTEPEGAEAARRIAPEEIALDSLSLAPSLRGATLTGRVTNGSARYRLREMVLDLRLHDCPEEATPLADCPVIGEASAIARPDVPPGQIRAFSVRYSFANVPEAAGMLRWDLTFGALRATP